MRRNGIFGLAVAAALVFGGAQAFASPGEAAARACSDTLCRQYCQSRGAPTGECVSGKCVCEVVVPPAS